MAESGYGEQLCANMLDLSPKSFKTRVSNSPLPVALIATILEPKLGQVGTKLGPGWDQFGTKLGPSWGQVGTKLGSVWAKMTPSWGQAGPGWAKSDHIRAMLGPCCHVLGRTPKSTGVFDVVHQGVSWHTGPHIRSTQSALQPCYNRRRSPTLRGSWVVCVCVCAYGYDFSFK